MSLSVLYLSYDGMTDPLGQSQVLPYLSGLARRGYSITLLSCEKPQRFATHQSQIEKFCNDHGIRWIPVPYTASPPVWSTLKDISTLKKQVVRLQAEYRFDIVHCRSYISAMIGLWMKKKYNTRFIFDMRGFWADERVDGGLWNLKNPIYYLIYKYFKRTEKQLLNQADAIISLTYAAKDEMMQWGIKGLPEITVIPCCVDTSLFDPDNLDKERRDKLKMNLEIPPPAMVLGYVGSLGTWYLLPAMVHFFKVWLKIYPQSILLFVTKEPAEMILSEVRKQQLDTQYIRIVSAQRTAMPYYISMMHYGLFFLKQSFSKKASSPVKQGELMAMGVPIICNAGVGDSDRIIQRYQAGVLLEHYQEASYQEVMDMVQQVNFDPTAIRKGCIDYFDLEKGIAIYEQVYKRLK